MAVPVVDKESQVETKNGHCVIAWGIRPMTFHKDKLKESQKPWCPVVVH